MEEEDGILNEILTEIESSGGQSALSESSISALYSLLCGRDNGDEQLWEMLSGHGLPASTLAVAISASMDSPDPRLSILASRAFLTALLAPSSPIYTLFNPTTFFSFLASLRRSLKPPPQSPGDSSKLPPQGSSSQRQDQGKSTRKKKARRGPAEFADVAGGDGVGKLLQQVLELLDSVLERVRLDAAPDGVKSLAGCLAGMLDSPITQQIPRISDICFRIFYRVVSKLEHGDQAQSTTAVSTSLAPAILSHTRSALRASAIEFVTRKLVPLGEENEAVRNALVYLPRFLANKPLDKSEPRACAVESILELVKVMSPEDQAGFVQYVQKMSRGNVQLRLVAVDMILGLLTTLPNPMGDEAENGEESESVWGLKCLEALTLRCSDSAARVRARALMNFGSAMDFLLRDKRNLTRLQKAIKLWDFARLLKERCTDDKAAVKKAALLLISKMTPLFGGSIDEVLLQTLGRACFDSLVSIRKAAASALSEIFRTAPDTEVIIEWLTAVPRLIIDNETTMQDECENLFLELVLDWISRIGNDRLSVDVPNLESLFPKEFLALLEKSCDGDVSVYVKKICTSLGKKKKLKSSAATALQNIITTSESVWLNNSLPIEKWTAPPGAWMLLSELSMFVPKAIDWKFLHHHWELLDKPNSSKNDRGVDAMELNSTSWASDRVSLLQIISNVAMELPPEPAAELAHNLLTRVKAFNMHFTEVDAHVKALRTLCKRKAARPEEGESLVRKCVDDILENALSKLEGYVTKFSKDKKANSFATPQSARRTAKKDAMESKYSLEVATAVFTIGSLVLVCPCADVKNIIPLLHTIITSGMSEGKPKKLAEFTESVRDTAPSLFIQSWVTMGKICLVDDMLAKRYIPLFMKELERSNCPALRNNIMFIVVDFCVRHTALVDCYIPKITKLLRDPCEIVRRQAFILLSRLLQRDYVKWKGVLFLRFLLALVDDSEKIRNLADFLFANFLKVKAPLLAYNSFVEAIFVLNDCRAHAGHTDNSKAESHLFSIRGNDEGPRARRMHIYVSLLKQMAPEQLLATSAKLCAEILAAASDGLLALDDKTAQSVLQDTLEVLACKEMRIQPVRVTDAVDPDEEGGDAGALAAAKGRVVTQLSKKNLVQHAIPIFIELKRLLQSRNSPLTGCLMECLRVLLADYKNEIEDILVADKQLQKELIYDMQKYEAAKARSIATEAVRAEGFQSPLAANPGNRSVNVYARVSGKLGTNKKIASAVTDIAAKAASRSVLKAMKKNVPTPPLSSMSVPRTRPQSRLAGQTTGGRDRPSAVLESVRRRQAFDSDDELQ